MWHRRASRSSRGIAARAPPSKFVQGDETVYLENTKKFTEATGVNVQVDFEGWEDLRPKIAVAANVGDGPDVVLAWSDEPHKYVDKIVDLSDLATYLGEKYGGWWPIAEKYGTKDGKWIAMPIGASGGRVVYRKSWVNEAGFEAVPEDVDQFLELCRKLKANGHPAGLALGNAVGDGNAWCNWVVWAFGGALVDENDQVTINSKETIEGLNYAKALYETFIPGTLSWLDPSNNKAFLAGEVGLTQNGISIYYAAKNSDDPAVKAMAEDIYHARMPIGPVGKSTERALVLNQMVFAYSKYPNAAKEFLRFTMEKEQYDPYLNACIGYWNHPLQAYDASAVWSADPKHEPFKSVLKDASWDSYKGTIRAESAAVLADFVIVQMVASVCSGQATPEEAAAEAEQRTKRYYKT
ncbi:MAG: extracellular solute-binding protein [Rhodospirillaceae bacterium]|nr:extracellular solute-binding protein [Rhodospirillaceae bacterium]